jgi:4a-hydroxytetrahydrobiopterin dehydratase
MAKEAVLSEEALAKATAELPGWELVGGELVRQVTFVDFVKAMEFVNRVAEKAEAAGHHPDIDIRYNKVRLALVTHDSGGITSKDVAMARDRSEGGGTT